LAITLLGAGTPGGEFALAVWDNLGINVTFRDDDANTANSVLFGGGPWDVCLISFNGVQLPSIEVPVFAGPAPPNGLNVGQVANPTYAGLAARASAQTGAKACATWNAAERSLYAEYDALPVSYITEGVYSKGVAFDVFRSGIVATSLRIER